MQHDAATFKMVATELGPYLELRDSCQVSEERGKVYQFRQGTMQVRLYQDCGMGRA